MRSIEESEAFLEAALERDVRGRLVDRGEARAMMRREGQLPDDAPEFLSSLDSDLADYGFSILDAALELRELQRYHQLLRPAFKQSGRVFEALVKHAEPSHAERGFYRMIAATAYHLAGYAAMAYAVLSDTSQDELNLNAGERALRLLILRDLDQLRKLCQSWLTDSDHDDLSVASAIEYEETDRDEALGIPVLAGLLRALAYVEFALQTGERSLIERAKQLLDAAYGLAEIAGLVALWWIVRLVRELIDDIWRHSLHEVIPRTPSGMTSADYSSNRQLFIAQLFCRDVSQVELWPSQVAAATRAADSEDDLVVALPTSAGKTRIAELATLTCLSAGKRVLIVTPLRALSAQTERSFRETFSALGASVSSLYGKSGLSSGDRSALGSDAIVVATPEKLDFALRSDPRIIDDVGLVVLDEGHMIGAEEREIRFEILVQRLLRRADAADRRVVCLSAILPEGQELAELTAWIRSDEPGEPVRSEWRPTTQRYGTIEWRGDHGALRYDLEEDGPFVTRFLTQLPARPPHKASRPTNKCEVTLLSAWRFAEEGKRTLIFVTQANWVEGFAKHAIELVNRGYLPSLLDDEEAIQEALTIGRECLGENHPAVACLTIGVAIHHGGLPSAFLREIERLLANGVINVSAASPTLAQGINVNAAVLLVPYLVRAGVTIRGEEFANVAGRAGRAYVDTEGLILHVIEDRYTYRKGQWCDLIDSVKTRSLRSGLIELIGEVIWRLRMRHHSDDELDYEYLANAREDWLREPVVDLDATPLPDLIARLDGVIFGLIEALDCDADNLPEMLDEALAGSLWDRQLEPKALKDKNRQRQILLSRARLIWKETTVSQRRGHFAMGVGLDSGLDIDAQADALVVELDRADLAAMQADADTQHDALVAIASSLLRVKPFIPDNDMPVGWQQVLRTWLSGSAEALIDTDNIALIEDAFVYRLVWAMEALRARRAARSMAAPKGSHGGMSAACVDTGLPDYRMSMLVRAGLTSRQAAKIVIEELNPDLPDSGELRHWLRSEEIATASANPDWPSPETAKLWQRFRGDLLKDLERAWSIETDVISDLRQPKASDVVCRIEASEHGHVNFLTPDYRPIPLQTTGSDISISDACLVYGQWNEERELEVVSIGPMASER